MQGCKDRGRPGPSWAIQRPVKEDSVSEALLHKPVVCAELLDCSRSQVYEYIATGELEAVRLGSRLRVPHDALVRFIERLREGDG